MKHGSRATAERALNAGHGGRDKHGKRVKKQAGKLAIPPELPQLLPCHEMADCVLPTDIRCLTSCSGLVQSHLNFRSRLVGLLALPLDSPVNWFIRCSAFSHVSRSRTVAFVTRRLSTSLQMELRMPKRNVFS